MQSKFLSFFRSATKSSVDKTRAAAAVKRAPVVVDQQAQRHVGGGLPQKVW